MRLSIIVPILDEAEEECPAPDEAQRKGRRGKLPRSKARNLDLDSLCVKEAIKWARSK